MANLQIRIDEELKNKAQAVAKSMGLDLASAVRIFIAQMVRENALPFRPSGDPFYSEENMAFLRKSLKQLKAGNVKLHEVLIDE